MAFVTHILARYTVHTTQLEQGWMNTNAVSVLDLGRRKLHATVLLDDVDRGAANPWGVAVSPNSKTLYVTHAGTDELSVIDVAAMLGRVAAAAPGEPANHLSFLLDIRRRIRLPGKGPRAVAVTGDAVWWRSTSRARWCVSGPLPCRSRRVSPWASRRRRPRPAAGKCCSTTPPSACSNGRVAPPATRTAAPTV